MTAARVAAAAGAWLALGAAAAAPCGESLGAGRRTVENTRYAVAYTTTPARIVVGEHFVVDFAVCPLGKAPAPRAVRVDASMPEHRHGMNYRTTVANRGPGRYRAEGLLFHMGGRWEIAFDVVTANATERITSAVVLE